MDMIRIFYINSVTTSIKLQFSTILFVLKNLVYLFSGLI